MRLATLCLLLAAPAAAQEAPVDLEQRVATLEEQLARLASEEGRGRSGYDGGFFVESADGDWRLKVGGLLQVNGWFYESDLPGRDSRAQLRRMRLEIEGELGPVARFALEPKLTETDFEFEEAWIGAELSGGDALLLVGRMKEPFGLEEFTPRKHVDFVEYSLLNQLSPAEDTGAFLFGELGSGALGYGLGVTSATSAEPLVADEGVAGRLVLKPFATSGRRHLEGLQVGAAATWGQADQDVSGESLALETREPFLAFEPGSAFDGDRTRLGLEAAWLSGPFAVQAETLHLEQDVSGAGGAGESDLDGWMASASWVLTGETKTWRGVRPARPALGGGGAGAWQLAVRFAELDLDDDLVALGLVAPAAYPGDVTSLDVGLNWYLTYEVRLKLHWVHSRYGDEIVVDGDPRSSEDALFVQAQMSF